MSDANDDRGRFRRLGRKILGEDGDGARRLHVDVKEVLGAVIEGGDKAKTEVVRAVAREVRNYLEELGLKDDLHNLLTNYSLEARVSLNLRKLYPHEKGEIPPAPEPAPPPAAPGGEGTG